MKSFLLNSDYKPIIQWGKLPKNVYFQGAIPGGMHLACSPSDNIVIVDIDKKLGKNGFEHIPLHIFKELESSFYYNTKSGGAHCFIKYTGNKILKNMSTEKGIDLRIAAKGTNCGGYVRWQGNIRPEECLHLIKESSKDLNVWLENLFSNKINQNEL
mgnify:CR=1 FL=1